MTLIHANNQKVDSYFKVFGNTALAKFPWLSRPVINMALINLLETAGDGIER